MKIIYNPEGSALRRDQMQLLNMLLEFDKFCKKNNIEWWLSSGTLLGAARHKGFIPWDDDMDIVMMKNDYQKLEKLLCEDSDSQYVFHCRRTDPDYVNMFGKYRRKDGRVQSQSKRYDYYKWAGIGFDVFQMEKTSYFSARVAYRIYYLFQKPTIYIKNNILRKFLIRFNEFVCDTIIFPMLRLIGKINPNEEYHYVLGTGWPRHTFYAKNIYPLTTAEFEGVLLPVPQKIDEYLTLVYGDWRTMPSENDIMNSIHCVEYKNEILQKLK